MYLKHVHRDILIARVSLYSSSKKNHSICGQTVLFLESSGNTENDLKTEKNTVDIKRRKYTNAQKILVGFVCIEREDSYKEFWENSDVM